MRKLIGLSVLLTFLAATGVAFAEQADLVKLETEMWGLARDKKWKELEARLAPGFQSVNQRGILDLKGFMEASRKENLSDFNLSDFKITRTGPAAVVTYQADVAETIGGKRIPKQKAPRSSVWIKTNEGWKVILHTNCNPLGT